MSEKASSYPRLVGETATPFDLDPRVIYLRGIIEFQTGAEQFDRGVAPIEKKKPKRKKA